MKTVLTTAHIIALLQRRQKSLSLREFAKEIGISAPYLSDIYRGNRHPGPKVLKMLGLRRERTTTTVYFTNGTK